MPVKIKQLFCYFLLFNLAWGMSMELNNGGIIKYFKSNFESPVRIGLEITSTISFFLYALSAYLFLWYFTKKKRQALALILILACIPVVILSRYFIEEISCEAVFGFHNYNTGTSISYYMLDNKFYSIPYTAFGMLFYFVQSNRFKESEKMELLIQNRQAELHYLKSQINPHFLFNNLNNIYSLVYHKSDKSLVAIEQLSSLLQYMLYEKNEEVLLADEIAYLKNFIALQKLRYNFEIPLSISIEVQDENVKIAPLLLIPLVENAFKHCDLHDSNMPLTVHLSEKDNILQLLVQNKKGKHEKDSVPGIGISNLKRRLALLYENEHTFRIEESATCYKTTLKLNL